jgi:hydrogenase nickel incorporation protein HypB
LAQAVEYDLAAAFSKLHAVRPGIQIIRVSSKTGEGMTEWLELLSSFRTLWKAQCVAP